MLAVRKALGVLVSVLALVGVLITVAFATHRIDQRPRTDDAYLQADLVHMAPDVSGRIIELRCFRSYLQRKNSQPAPRSAAECLAL